LEGRGQVVPTFGLLVEPVEGFDGGHVARIHVCDELVTRYRSVHIVELHLVDHGGALGQVNDVRWRLFAHSLDFRIVTRSRFMPIGGLLRQAFQRRKGQLVARVERERPDEGGKGCGRILELNFVDFGELLEHLDTLGRFLRESNLYLANLGELSILTCGEIHLFKRLGRGQWFYRVASHRRQGFERSLMLGGLSENVAVDFDRLLGVLEMATPELTNAKA
jgi:hypothetical protein